MDEWIDGWMDGRYGRWMWGGGVIDERIDGWLM